MISAEDFEIPFTINKSFTLDLAISLTEPKCCKSSFFFFGPMPKTLSSSLLFMEEDLDNVYGIGPKKKKELLQHFGSVREIAKSSVKDLLMVKGISKSSAEIILNHFNS